MTNSRYGRNLLRLREALSLSVHVHVSWHMATKIVSNVNVLSRFHGRVQNEKVVKKHSTLIIKVTVVRNPQCATAYIQLQSPGIDRGSSLSSIQTIPASCFTTIRVIPLHSQFTYILFQITLVKPLG